MYISCKDILGTKTRVTCTLPITDVTNQTHKHFFHRCWKPTPGLHGHALNVFFCFVCFAVKGSNDGYGYDVANAFHGNPFPGLSWPYYYYFVFAHGKGLSFAHGKRAPFRAWQELCFGNGKKHTRHDFRAAPTRHENGGFSPPKIRNETATIFVA